MSKYSRLLRPLPILVTGLTAALFSTAAMAQLYGVTVDEVTGNVYELDVGTGTVSVAANSIYRSASNAVAGCEHYSENHDGDNTDGYTIVKVDVCSGGVPIEYTRTDLTREFNMASNLDGTIWEQDRGTQNLYQLVFDDTAKTVSRSAPIELPASINGGGDTAWGPDGLLYISTSAGPNYIWDPDTDSFTTFDNSEERFNGIAWFRGKLYGSVDVDGGGALYELDPSDMTRIGEAILTTGFRINDLAAWQIGPFECVGFFPPFDEALTVKKKVNRALPLKFRLYDDDGYEITDQDLVAPPVVQVLYGDPAGPASDEFDPDLLPSGLATDGNEFRYDLESEQWILNLGMKAYSAPGSYEISAVAPAGSTYSIKGCTNTFERLQ